MRPCLRDRFGIYLYDIGRDPHELKPRVVGADHAAYESETSLLTRWLELTDIASRPAALSKRDIDVLRSLGYLQ